MANRVTLRLVNNATSFEVEMGASLMDVLQSDNEDICERIDRENMIVKLYNRIKDTLNDRDRQIIQLRYGLCGANPLPQREVAKKLGISRSYVSRIEKKALIKPGE